MTLVRIFTCAAITLSALFGSAEAQSLTGSSPGFHYFYKHGAGMSRHDADLVACLVTTRGLINGSDAMTAISASTGGGLVGALIGGIIDNNENRQGAAANTENCMAIRGWSVIGLNEDEGLAMESPEDPASIHAKLEPLVDSLEPHGPVLRGPFANELVAGDFTVDQARDLEEVSMSVRAVRDQTDAALAAAGDLKPPKPPKLPKGVKAPKPAKMMDAAALAGADPAKSYLVLRLRGDNSGASFTSIMLQRLAADGTEIVYDGDVVTAYLGGRPRLAKDKVGDEKLYDFMVEVPPGLWKIAAIRYGAFAADLCFGAPAFEVKTGETLFLGVMTFAKSGGYPLAGDIDTAKEILASTPALAGKVREPEYTNGFLSDCFGSHAYAYEIPGAPVIDMATLKREADAKAAAAEAAALGAEAIETGPESAITGEEEPVAAARDDEDKG